MTETNKQLSYERLNSMRHIQPIDLQQERQPDNIVVSHNPKDISLRRYAQNYSKGAVSEIKLD